LSFHTSSVYIRQQIKNTKKNSRFQEWSGIGNMLDHGKNNAPVSKMSTSKFEVLAMKCSNAVTFVTASPETGRKQI